MELYADRQRHTGGNYPSRRNSPATLNIADSKNVRSYQSRYGNSTLRNKFDARFERKRFWINHAGDKIILLGEVNRKHQDRE